MTAKWSWMKQPQQLLCAPMLPICIHPAVETEATDHNCVPYSHCHYWDRLLLQLIQYEKKVSLKVLVFLVLTNCSAKKVGLYKLHQIFKPSAVSL